MIPSMKTSSQALILASLCCSSLTLSGFASEPTPDKKEPKPSEKQTPSQEDNDKKPSEEASEYMVPDGQTVPKAEKIDEHRVRIGKVEVNAQEKSFSFPAVLNMDEGLIEYAISMPHGKAHETLLFTMADPLHMSVAAKLLDFKSYKKLFPQRDPETLEWIPFKRPSREDYKGSLVEITAKWKDKDGKEQKAPLSSFIRFKNTKQKLAEHEWVINDSLFHNKCYQASRMGDTIAIFGDGSAFISYAGFENSGSNVWMAEKSLLPERGTEFTITIKKLPEDKVKLPASTAPENDISVPKS